MTSGGTKGPEAAYEPFLRDLRGAFGDGLLSAAVYGSAARGDWRPGDSDINFLVILDDRAILDLENAFGFVKGWQKRGIAIPLFLTEEYIRGALDAYPLEFLNMQSAYRVLLGPDPLAALRFERRAVRLQCEREARGYLLHLRRGYLAGRGRARDLRALIVASLPGYHALFRGLLWVAEGRLEAEGGEAVRRAAALFGLDAELFERLERVRRGEKAKGEELLRLADRFLEEARKLAIAVDRWESDLSGGGE
ncbi:MAG: nucleotidyltransferase domain-containing protein [Candidatus Eisenbacteria bacterium]|nr:nucleotidyltransferase domain-containing protein [Candidatus Eisenbacteria bacterium]